MSITGVIMIQVPDIFGAAVVAAITSFLFSLLIVATQGWHGKFSLDGDFAGIQKFHKRPVPRIGGVALLIGMSAALAYDAIDFSNNRPEYTALGDIDDFFKLLLASLPSFLVGLTEDLTKRVSVMMRLLATFASALAACMLLGVYLSRLDTWGVDSLLQLMPFAILLTMIAVAGVANSINIIDGFHGVASSAVAIMLAGIAFVAWEAGDHFVTKLGLLGIGVSLGFLVVNFPTGRIFMGDGGAYFLGFWLAEVAVLLVARNTEVSVWQVLAICAYPVIEVLFSIYRRKVIRKASPGAPDRLHLHTLLYRRVVCQILPRDNARPWIRNAAVACILGTTIAVMVMVSVWVGDSATAATSVVLVEVTLYVAVYARLVRGRWRMAPAFVSARAPDMRSGSTAREIP